MRPSRTPVLLGLALALAAGAAAPALGADVMLVGIDRKFAYDEEGRRRALAPGRDELLAFDLADPATPRLLGALPLENSVVGPPTNIAVTPDGRLALVASSVRSERDEAAPGGGWRTVPADELAVLDLSSGAPRLLRTLQVGRQPSGVAVHPNGRLALVANREGRSVTVLRISGTEVTVAGTVPLGAPVASVAITPDGRRALAVKFNAHAVALLDIGADGQVSYAGRDLTVGLWPYTVAISPDGRTALVTNTGSMAASDGNADTVSVIDLAADPPRTVDHVTVGDAPEGVVASPRGGLAAVSVLDGSYDAPAGAWYRRPAGRVVTLRLAEGRVAVAGSVTVGSFPEGIAFAPDGSHVYVGNFASETLSVLKVGPGGALADTGRTIRLPGPPASLRIGSQ